MVNVDVAFEVVVLVLHDARLKVGIGIGMPIKIFILIANSDCFRTNNIFGNARERETAFAISYSLVTQFQNGQLTEKEMLDLIKDNLLKFEISTNAIKQSLLSSKNQQAKKDNAAADADFVISTIHSAKGLEFQNVIVLYRNENQMEEDKKRMYYVAFTRAMSTEYILAYDTMTSPQIQADYVTVLEHLHAIAPSPNSIIDQLAAKRKRSNRIKI